MKFDIIVVGSRLVLRAGSPASRRFAGSRRDAQRIPGCTYSRRPIASVGLTEAQAKAAGYDIRVGRFPFAGNGEGGDQGPVKTVFDASIGKLLDAHMFGPKSRS
jgi:pyruvate/2-oxoglutarate dehydrogenase complex dihydrolipoamide dehydrogenase (E3) component